MSTALVKVDCRMSAAGVCCAASQVAGPPPRDSPRMTMWFGLTLAWVRSHE